MQTLQWTRPESFLNSVTLSSTLVATVNARPRIRYQHVPAIGGACKTTVGYSDEIINICDGGLGFKIRCQWRITNWCTNKDTVLCTIHKREDKGKLQSLVLWMTLLRIQDLMIVILLWLFPSESGWLQWLRSDVYYDNLWSCNGQTHRISRKSSCTCKSALHLLVIIHLMSCCTGNCSHSW